MKARLAALLAGLFTLRRRGSITRAEPPSTQLSSRWWRPAAILLVVLTILALAPLAFIYSGVFDVAASRQHTPPVYWALITTLRQSVLTRADREIGPPPADLVSLARFDRGLVLYEEYCLPCHGAPGVPMSPIGQSLTPAPANLVLTGREWTPEEVFWTVKNGLKMTGMPAWGHHLSEDEMWSIVTFVKTLHTLAPVEYKQHREKLVPAHSVSEQRRP